MLWEHERFTPKNVQPKQADLSVCPFYSVIDLASQFAGITSDDLSNNPRFCGYKVAHEDTLSFLSGHTGDNYYPKTSCTEMRDMLNEQMHIVSEDYPIPTSDELKNMLDAEQDLGKKDEILQSNTRNFHLATQKEQILKRWQQMVFEVSAVPVGSDINDPHFRHRSKEEIGVDEALGYVKKIIIALEEQVTGPGSKLREGIIILGSTKAIHCPQTPHFHQT